MVKKISRRGLYSSTGNTIRDYRQNAALRQYQKYGCLVMGAQADIKKNPKDKSIMSDIHTHIPQTDSGVEFSLNKRRRWELPSYLKQKVCAEANSQHVEITVMEHILTVPRTGGIVDMNTCNSYYNNVGPVTECVSKSEMTVESAKHGHRDQDHLSKLERRSVKKAEREGRTQTLDEADEEDEGSCLAQYEFHIAYGAPTDGNLFKELATKGFAKNIRKNRNVSGWSKRFLPLGTLDMADKFEEENYADSDILDYEDDAAYECMHQPHDITLSDFLKPTARPKKCKRRTLDNVKDQVTRGYKERVVYILTSREPTKQPTPYTPSYTEVAIKQSEMEATNLMRRFAENFVELACTPRIVTLDLTDKLDSEYDGRFYLVLALQSEEQHADNYRAYCTGTGITSSSSQIRSLYSGSEYSLTDLVNHALSHHRELLIAHGRTPNKLNAGSMKIPSFNVVKWDVKSAYIEDITEVRRKADREMARKNIEAYLESIDDFVLIPWHHQTVSNCGGICGSCGINIDSGDLYFALVPCLHYFCNGCWGLHITKSITERNFPMTCPAESKCSVIVETGLIMTLVEYELYTKYELHLTEYLLFSQNRANWCPNKSCARVLYCGDELADRDDPVPVQCDCGTECCFRCLGEPHWPLSCSRVKPYHDRLVQSGLEDLLNMTDFKVSPTMVEKRACPHCNLLVDPFRNYYTPTEPKYYHFYSLVYHQECDGLFCWTCGDAFTYPWFRQCHHCVYLTDDTTSVNHSRLGYQRLMDRRIRASRNILEHCCALNSFQAEKQFCVQLISELTFHLTMSEAETRRENYGKRDLQRLAKLYNNLKQKTRDLVVQMSAALRYVKPIYI